MGLIDDLLGRFRRGSAPERYALPSPKALVAAARRMTEEKIRGGYSGIALARGDDWQASAWDMYESVGEQWFLANQLAGRTAKAKLYVGRVETDGVDDDPVELSDVDRDGEPLDSATLENYALVRRLLSAFGQTKDGRAQLIKRYHVNLFVAGECWLLGVPTPDYDNTGDPFDVDWSVLSSDELSYDRSSDSISAVLPSDGERHQFNADDVTLIRVWQPHPRNYEEADSGTRPALGPLMELVSLSNQVNAQITSRLAGNGLLAIPNSAEVIGNYSGDGEDDSGDGHTDSFVEALVEAMIEPISDRESAASVVPLVVRVPDEAINGIRHLTFSTPLDSEARNLRDESIRRLALSQDTPPEVLLGTASMNHWGGWLVKEETVETHIEPKLALLCHALTTQYLWPTLVNDYGWDEGYARQFVISYDVNHLHARPNASQDALNLHERGAMTDEALVAELGYSDSVLPPKAEEVKTDRAVQIALDMLVKAPSLATDPGLTELISQIRSAIDGSPDDVPVREDDTRTIEETTGLMPNTAGDPADIGGDSPS